jgi:hypothetical protein
LQAFCNKRHCFKRNPRRSAHIDTLSSHTEQALRASATAGKPQCEINRFLYDPAITESPMGTETKRMSAAHSTPASPKRRWFLKTALAVTAAVGAVGAGVWWHRGFDQGKLTPDGKSVFRAMARGILGNMLPTGPEREAILDQHMSALEHLINTLPKAKRDQISLLAGALANAPTRYLAAGRWASWDTASDDEVREILHRLQQAGNIGQNMVYAATRALTALTFFSIPDQWSRAGYPGPMAL